MVHPEKSNHLKKSNLKMMKKMQTKKVGRISKKMMEIKRIKMLMTMTMKISKNKILLLKQIQIRRALNKVKAKKGKEKLLKKSLKKKKNHFQNMCHLEKKITNLENLGNSIRN